MNKPARLPPRHQGSASQPEVAPEDAPSLSPAVVHALRTGLMALDRAARQGDQPAIYETARAMAELAERNGLDQVRWQARALLNWHEDERAASTRLTSLIDGLFLSSARLLPLDTGARILH